MALMIIELGRWDISTEAMAQFQEDVEKDEVEILKRRGDLRVPEVARELAREFFQTIARLKQRATGPIRLVLSGPVALCFLFGMIVGLNHFDLEIFHYDATSKGEKYVSIGSPTHEWLE